MEKINIMVFIDRENKKMNITLSNSTLAGDLLKKLNINPVTVIISRNNELILEEEKLKDKDEIKILSVISGG